MKTNSIWLEQIKQPKEPVLRKDISCDVLIVGGGMTGVSLAYHLKDQNLDVVVVDKNQIGHGISSRTTGKITYLQDTIYSDLDKMYSKKESKMYYEAQKEAIKFIVDTVSKHHIDCNLEKVNSCIFSTDSSRLVKEKELLTEFGASIKEKTVGSQHQLIVGDTYVFHPVKYILGLKEVCKKSGVTFYEHTDIHFLKTEEAYYVCGNELATIRAKKIVFACHYPYFLFPFLMPLKCTLEKSYLIASKVEKAENYSAISVDKSVISIRYHSDQKDHYMLYLSESHPLYREYDFKKHFEIVMKRSNLKPDYIWSNHDIMTYDQLPFIGRLSRKDCNMYLATGYNTWGMTNSHVASRLIKDLILDIYNPYQELFSPLRKLFLSKIPESIYSGMKPMIENKVWKNKKWYPENVYYESRNGKNVAIYVDKLGKEHIVYNICPHLKCSLLFNSVEKTWDCPCHGSRFDLDGKVLIGPSNYDIGYHKK